MTSIFAAIRSAADAGEDVEALTLPDTREEAGKVGFAPGALDGILGHHSGGGGADAGPLIDAIAAAGAGPADGERYQAVYDLATSESLLGMLDTVLRAVRQQGDSAGLYGLACWLATEAADRGPVKLGIGLLGLFGVEPHRDVLQLLGRHVEFTLYAAVALANGQPDPDEDLWRLATRVHGWGRIHLVERLASTSRRDIRDWMLRDGFRNSVMDEYLAYIAATSGGLLAALQADEVDDELLYAAGDLFAALFAGGPARDIDDYADGAAAAAMYVRHVARREPDLRHLIGVGEVRDYARRPVRADGWSEVAVAQIEADSAAVVARPGWAALVEAGLGSDAREEFWRANRASQVLGRASVGPILRRLRVDPEPSLWFEAMRLADDRTIGDVVGAAVEILPMADIASGPGVEIGLGSRFADHQSLDFVLQGLAGRTDLGWELVLAGLRSPVIRNRNMAIRVIAGRPRASWPGGIEPAIRSAIPVEPNAEVRQRMEGLLA